MTFVGHLAIALGRTLADVIAMSAAEFAFWRLFRERNGFPADRIEGGVAVAGAAQCNAWGAKVEPKDLLPRFGPKRTNMKMLAAQLASLPGAKVRRIPRPDRKAAAVAKEEADAPAANRPRLLNPKK